MASRKPTRKKTGPTRISSTAEFEKRLAAKEQATSDYFVLQLYVAGTSPRSVQAVENVNALCQECLAGHYELKVIDIYQQPDAAIEAQLVAAPTLIKRLPEPLRRFIGDFADRERVLRGLKVEAKPGPSSAEVP